MPLPLLNPHFLPYEELTFSWQTGSACSLSTPWLTLSTQFHPKDRERVEKVEKFMAGKTTQEQSQPELDWLLGQFAKYPIAYVLPRTDASQDVWRENPNTLDGQWPMEEMLARARIEGKETYDPISVLTIARRWQFKEFSRYLKPDAEGILTEFLKRDEKKFIEFAALSLRQIQFFTASTQSVLQQGPAKELVKPYLRSEQGHEYLIAQGLKDLGYPEPEKLPIHDEKRAVIDCLRECAEHHFLAFCLLIDAFEQVSENESDPLVEALKSSKKTAGAVTGLQKHHDINRQKVARNLVLSLPAVDRNSALAAFRYAERHSRLAEAGYGTLWKAFERR